MSKKTRILIVDDEPSMCKTLGDILHDDGYDVSTAEDGLVAVQMCSENQYDVILMDVRMPGLDGVEAFRQIRRHQEGVRVIMMSGFGMEDLKLAALDEGAIAFLEKPLELEKVIRIIDESTETAILVVEEDEKTASSIRSTLKGRGYHVSIAHSPNTALELIEQIHFDIILIDVELPVMSGLDLYLAIKKLTPSAVAIMITGNEDEFVSIAREAVRRTAYTLLYKPLDLDHLLDLLEKIRNQKASEAIHKPDKNDA